MIRPRRYFPWRLARQVFFSHFLFVLVTLVLTGFSLRYFLYTELVHSNDIYKTLGRFDSYLTSLFATVLVFAAIYLALTSRAYARPLGRMIQRARELRRLNAEIPTDELDPEELEEEPAEWTDLERALNRIHRDLKSRTDDLSREREELSALIGAVSDAILAVGIDETPLFFNPQFALLFGGKEREGRRPSLSEMFRSPDILNAFREVQRTGERRTMAASLHTKASSGLRREFSISIAPLKEVQTRESGAETEDVFGVVGIFHDVTELKQSEQIRIEFVGNASHELRTPITNIKGYVETLKEDFNQGRFDGAKPFIDIISKNVDRLIFLVNDLLDLSTLEQGAELTKSVVNTRDVTETTLKSLESKRAAKTQTIQIQDSAGQLMADPRRLEQVLTNLIENAIKYSPERSRIEVVWELEGEDVILRVRDNGAGIPPEHHSRLFERFYRVDAGRSREQGGTGLGLAIVKHIMLKHGGSVRITTRAGQPGSEFICVFPRAVIF